MLLDRNSILFQEEEKSKERMFIESLMNKTCKIKISDGRTLVGSFLCTDKEQNIILGQCQEYVNQNGLEEGEEPRTLGLAMVPGRHIVSIHIDTNVPEFRTLEHPLGKVNFVADTS